MSEVVVRAYLEDTDAGGIVYHASYLRFMERGRTEWLRELGMNHVALIDEHAVIFVVARMQIEFLRPARLDSLLVVRTSEEKVGRASVSLLQEVRDAEAATVHCTARVRLGCVASGALRPARMPNCLRDLMRKRELPGVH